MFSEGRQNLIVNSSEKSTKETPRDTRGEEAFIASKAHLVRMHPKHGPSCSPQEEECGSPCAYGARMDETVNGISGSSGGRVGS